MSGIPDPGRRKPRRSRREKRVFTEVSPALPRYPDEPPRPRLVATEKPPIRHDSGWFQHVLIEVDEHGRPVKG